MEVCNSVQKQTKQGTGKPAELKMLQDELTGALIGLACTCMTNVKTENTDHLIVQGLMLTSESCGCGEQEIRQMTDRIHREKDLVAPGCAACAERCANTADYDMEKIRNEGEEIKTLKFQILTGIREMASGISCNRVQDDGKEKVSSFLQRALFVLAQDWEKEQLRTVVCEMEQIRLFCPEQR